MMTLEVALVMTVGGIVGSILVSQMWQMNWFKRENFKFKQSRDRKENSIRFRKLERDLKIKDAPPEPPQEKSFIDTIKNIDPEIIKTLAGAFSKEDRDDYDYDIREPEEKPDLTEIIADVAKSNPELVNKLVDKFVKKPGDENDFTTQG